jgi:pyruvate dehydrogenase E2 component (dihydrolipoamide acetyltransferase)
MIKDIRIPEISENVTSGKVVDVLVKPGDDVEVDDPVIEFETEKAVVEIPSPFKGRITEILVKEGDELKVGDVVAKIDTEGAAERKDAGPGKEEEAERKAGAGKAAQAEADAQPPPQEEQVPLEEVEAEKEPEREKEQAQRQRKERPQDPGRAEPEAAPAPASPSVRRYARELGVDIHAVRPAEEGGRISEADVKAYVKRTRAAAEGGAPAAPEIGPLRPPELPDFSRWGEIESRELSTVRRLTAEKMAASWQAVAHVTQFERVDITAVLEFMRRKSDRVAAEGGRLTITAVLMKACAAALGKFSQFNASIDMANRRLILKKYIHIGIAVDTPRGLLVPVVRNADRKTILELAVEIVDLARRAREKKITPDEMEGGTFTISNQGGIGGTDFTPVVFWPQAAILGVSRAATEPRYIDGELRPRQVLPLALSYDHRIADGADAARFVRYIREGLEHPLALHFD